MVLAVLRPNRRVSRPVESEKQRKPASAEFEIVKDCNGSFEVVASRKEPELWPATCAFTSPRSADFQSARAISRPEQAYRTHFSVIDRSRTWKRGQQRCIRWVFGLTHGKSPNRDGKTSGRHQFNEHCIELIWTSKSREKGKVFWNNRCIGTLGRPRNCLGERHRVQLSWMTPSGTAINLLATLGSEFTDDRNQCLLYVGGTNFFSLPAMRSLRTSRGPSPTFAFSSERREFFDHELQSDLFERAFDESASVSESSLNPKVDAVMSIPGNSLSYRLSLAGLDTSAARLNHDNGWQQDELHSDLYSPLIEALRTDILYFLPQAEQDVSRAIMNAFSTDTNSMQSIESTLQLVDAFQLEANHVWKVVTAVRQHKPIVSGHLSSKFLQSCIEDVVLCIRNEQLTSAEASNIILTTASVLGLDFAHTLPKTTIGFEDKTGTLSMSVADVRRCFSCFSCFGEVEDVVLCSTAPSFGLCRFVNEASIAEVELAHACGELSIGNILLTLHRI